MIQSTQEREATKQKLLWLEERLKSLQQEPAENAHVRELTVQSLQKMIKQLKEEIARFEAGVGAEK